MVAREERLDLFGPGRDPGIFGFFEAFFRAGPFALRGRCAADLACLQVDHHPLHVARVHGLGQVGGGSLGHGQVGEAAIVQEAEVESVAHGPAARRPDAQKPERSIAREAGLQIEHHHRGGQPAGDQRDRLLLGQFPECIPVEPGHPGHVAAVRRGGGMREPPVGQAAERGREAGLLDHLSGSRVQQGVLAVHALVVDEPVRADVDHLPEGRRYLHQVAGPEIETVQHVVIRGVVMEPDVDSGAGPAHHVRVPVEGDVQGFHAPGAVVHEVALLHRFPSGAFIHPHEFHRQIRVQAPGREAAPCEVAPFHERLRSRQELPGRRHVSVPAEHHERLGARWALFGLGWRVDRQHVGGFFLGCGVRNEQR